MTFSMRRVSAIFRKEVQDFKTNSQVLLMAFLPIILSFLFSRFGVGKEMLGITTITAFLFVAGFVQSMVIAEEKEKHTLRVLMLSPASSVEVLLGKSILTACLTLGICIVNLFILDQFSGNLLLLGFIFLCGTILFIVIGTMIGLLAASVPQTSIIGMPILMTMYLAVQFEPMVENKVIKTMIGYLPTSHIVKALNSLVGGAGFSSISGHVLNVAIWLIIALIACLIVYKKKQMD
ncbi:MULTISPECIES: ABC transporter permease [Bacillus]|uniref:ABC transporter permease n=3 Tax=Bacillus thuringiensis TaxID=1428 RepID=A0AAP4V4Z5_BACTU|nr:MULTISPECIES: ABC transporter permease [Bacillus]MEC2874171.1 ABC transporter permease [Bacillus cereus]AEA18977.1 ABC transporter permease protein [Bacillus thuringiensis serovar chinensis CT-43]AFV21135.1 ABC transporter permease protein [Bacillus thuringiensis Bt407]AGG04121.1 ABC transporter, permease protein, putative [Bacillus thuringiensis serovar thuringiensis str. IS5056]ARP60601.1 ABC transporter permease [Bacillus thuringiensis]